MIEEHLSCNNSLLSYTSDGLRFLRSEWFTSWLQQTQCLVILNTRLLRVKDLDPCVLPDFLRVLRVFVFSLPRKKTANLNFGR